MESPPLAGRTIAVPETRELEVFAAMLERRGARVLRCPLVAIRDAPDPAPVLAFARAFAQEAFDDVVLTPGEGLRRILGCIERHEPELRAAFLAAPGRGRKINPGPKPAAGRAALRGCARRTRARGARTHPRRGSRPGGSGCALAPRRERAPHAGGVLLPQAADQRARGGTPRAHLKRRI